MTVKNVVDLYDLPFELEGPEQARVNSLPTPEKKTWRNAMPLTEVTMSTPLGPRSTKGNSRNGGRQ